MCLLFPCYLPPYVSFEFSSCMKYHVSYCCSIYLFIFLVSTVLVIYFDLDFFSPLKLSQEEATTFYDELNHHIFELVSSTDGNEKKGGILAIGELSLPDKIRLDYCLWITVS